MFSGICKSFPNIWGLKLIDTHWMHLNFCLVLLVTIDHLKGKPLPSVNRDCQETIEDIFVSALTLVYWRTVIVTCSVLVLITFCIPKPHPYYLFQNVNLKCQNFGFHFDTWVLRLYVLFYFDTCCAIIIHGKLLEKKIYTGWISAIQSLKCLLKNLERCLNCRTTPFSLLITFHLTEWQNFILWNVNIFLSSIAKYILAS